MNIDTRTIHIEKPFTWAVAVFASRENPSQLLSTINAIKAADENERTLIDIMVNGNPQLASDISKLLRVSKSSTSSLVIRVWSISLGDKAHAWNQYVHQVWPGARCSFFVDGYVRVEPSALRLLDDGLTSCPGSLGGTGAPTTGRTAANSRRHLLAEGGLQGNLFALKKDTMNQLRQRKFNLPLGIYRTDSTLGAALAFGLDPSRHEWDLKGRIFVHPEVTWTTDERKWWHYAEIKSQFRRILRQAQGVLENKAVQNCLAHQKMAPEKLPYTVSELVLEWMQHYPDDARLVLRKNPLSKFALKKFSKHRDWSSAMQPPQLVEVIE